MKKTFFKLTLLLAIGLGLNACTKSTPSTTTTTTSTTPSFTASMNGASNTFSATGSSGSTYFTITATNSSYNLYLNIKQPLSVGTVVSLNASPNSYAYVTTGAGQYWATSSSVTGTLTISANNTSAKTVSGTFSFTAASSTGGANMAVTSGSFTNTSY
jgi:hypothetical protein